MKNSKCTKTQALLITSLLVTLLATGCLQNETRRSLAQTERNYEIGSPEDFNLPENSDSSGENFSNPDPVSGQSPENSEDGTSKSPQTPAIAQKTIGEFFAEIKKISVTKDSSESTGYRLGFRNASDAEISIKDYFSRAVLVEAADFYFLQLIPGVGTNENPLVGATPYNLVVTKTTGKLFNLNASLGIIYMDLNDIRDQSAQSSSGTTESYVTLPFMQSSHASVRYGIRLDVSRQELQIVTIS